MNAFGITESVDNGITLIGIDNPPVNALAQPVREALLRAIVRADGDDNVRAIVIHGFGRMFVAGADLREFDSPPRAPLLNDVLLRIEATRKPVIAALHGVCLGGGVELALACHYRCAVGSLSLGLPEIKLALLPGSGGTQRLPRLIGVAPALDMMLSGLSIDAGRALELGILDRLLEGNDVLPAAINFAADVVTNNAGPRRLCERRVDGSDIPPGYFAAQRARAIGMHPGVAAAGYIVDCTEAAVDLPFHEGLALSRRLFEECRESVASRALRHLFFGERSRDPDSTRARPIHRVAVLGAGTMGTGIAISLAGAGVEVTLIDPADAALDAALLRLRSTFAAAVTKERITASQAQVAIANVAASRHFDRVAEADFVIEAVFESIDVKREVFASLDRHCRKDAILATNTSTLDVDAIAAATTRPQAVVGMHFFSPANIMRLVEIVKGRATTPEVIATVLSLTRRIGKLGVVVGNGFGFVGNRMLYAYGRENQLMLLSGTNPLHIDAALRDFGMAMGPNAVGDLAGLDVGYRIRRGRPADPDPRHYRVFDVLVEAGRFGQKTGRGVFKYTPDSRIPMQDPEVDLLIAGAAAQLKVARRPESAAHIVGRCIHALINEGAYILGEGIASRAADIDAIWCNGYGFPRLRGGPMFYADTLGLAHVLGNIAYYADVHGSGHWTPAPLLLELASRGMTFSQWDRARQPSAPD